MDYATKVNENQIQPDTLNQITGGVLNLLDDTDQAIMEMNLKWDGLQKITVNRMSEAWFDALIDTSNLQALEGDAYYQSQPRKSLECQPPGLLFHKSGTGETIVSTAWSKRHYVFTAKRDAVVHRVKFYGQASSPEVKWGMNVYESTGGTKTGQLLYSFPPYWLINSTSAKWWDIVLPTDVFLEGGKAYNVEMLQSGPAIPTSMVFYGRGEAVDEGTWYEWNSFSGYWLVGQPRNVEFWEKPPGSWAEVKTVPTIIDYVPKRTLLIANTLSYRPEDVIEFFISRDGGITWLPITPNQPADLSSQPAGRSLVVRAVIYNSAKLTSWALAWS